MRRSIELALRYGPRIAAHPSYPDREQFGRARMAIPLELLFESIVAQMTTLSMIGAELGTHLWGAKLHGALYHAAAEDAQLAEAVLDAVVTSCSDKLVIVGPPGGCLEAATQRRRLRYAREGFADRAYDVEGHLVPRGVPGDVIGDPATCADQALRLARSGTVETICVHGDNPHAVAIAREVRAALRRDALLDIEPGEIMDEDSPSSS
jgi:UPF0271 protein